MADAGEIGPRLTATVEAIADVVSAFEPERYSGQDAAALVSLFTRIERLGAAGKGLAARRVEETKAWKASGARSAADWLGRTTGSTAGQAAKTLTTSRRLRDDPDLDAAVRAGSLSGTQATEIAQAADDAPGSARELIRQAQEDSVQGLREHCQAARAAHLTDDARSRHRHIHEGRYLHTWVDADGAGRIDARLTANSLARLRARLAPFERHEFDTARRQGRRERQDLYALDALLAAVDSGSERRAAGPVDLAHPDGGAPAPDPPIGPAASGRRRRPRRRENRAPNFVIVRVDVAALDRGHTEAGERCEIDGVGPVPVEVAESLMADAFVAAVLTDGIDIRRVIHLGRSATAAQRTALYVRDPECVVPGCHVRSRLEIDHVTGWTRTHKTCLDDLARLCHHHHALKTRSGWKLHGPPGAWTFSGPDGTVIGPDPPTPTAAPDPDGDAASVGQKRSPPRQLGFPDA